MNLLLLLSAFLTALTGAITGVRPVQGMAAEQVGVAAGAASGVVSAVRARAGMLPVQGWQAATVAVPVLRGSIQPAAALAPWRLRRRE